MAFMTRMLFPALLTLISFPALAQSTLDECAAQAASQYEIGYESIGRDMTAMDATLSVQACELALPMLEREVVTTPGLRLWHRLIPWPPRSGRPLFLGGRGAP